MKSRQKRYRLIPRLFTYCNLALGAIATALVLEDVNSVRQALIFIIAGILCDGIAIYSARKFNASSAFGKELHWIAQMVTLGVAPSVMLFELLQTWLNIPSFMAADIPMWKKIIPFSAFLLTVAIAFVLAKIYIGFSKSKAFSGRSYKSAKNIHALPWVFTMLNILAGMISIGLAAQMDVSSPSEKVENMQMELFLVPAAYLIGVAAIFDYLDGFMARLLKAHTPLGKAFDSISDIISFGLAPGMIIYQLLKASFEIRHISFPDWDTVHIFYNERLDTLPAVHLALLFVAAMIPMFAATRLAKYNIDIRQKHIFIGMATPASAIVIASMALIKVYNPDSWQAVEFITNSPYYQLTLLFFQVYVMNLYFILIITIGMSVLMVVEIPMFSLKFTNFSLRSNRIRYLFLFISFVLLVIFRPVAIPMIILLYVLFSAIGNSFRKIQERERERRFAETLGRAFVTELTPIEKSTNETIEDDIPPVIRPIGEEEEEFYKNQQEEERRRREEEE